MAKEKVRPNGEARKIVEHMIERITLPTAISVVVAEYYKLVHKGEILIPACKRTGDSVRNIWIGTRIEALSNLFGYGSSNIELLSTRLRQAELIDTYFTKRPQYEYPHNPTNEPVHDTLQALFKVYLYLLDAGTKVGDQETDKFALRLANKTIVEDFERDIEALRGKLVKSEREKQSEEVSLDGGSTILDVLYDDVTKKSKSIALSSVFGPNYVAAMASDIERLRQRMEDRKASDDEIDSFVENARASMQAILNARDPDTL